jgi:BirA family transcriptional regulator, biotin operon repressor / biotin---[acetyl-CoA-carboxylase] ligase
MPETLPSEFEAALRLTADRRGQFGERIFYYGEIGSTNDDAARLAEHGAPQGTIVVASAQSSGRGRFGRAWFSPAGAGLYVSVIVRDRQAAPLLTLAGGVAVAEGILAATGLPTEIKWPNDVVVHAGKRRKLAGVLAEGSTTADGLQYVILGFGINLRPAAYPPEIADRATSLETELGRPVDAALVFAETLAALAKWAAALADGNTPSLLARWRELSPLARGATVEWETPDGPRSGRTIGIDDAGALLVRSEDRTERIISGVVHWM